MKPRLLSGAVLLPMLVAINAYAAPKSIGDCEQIKDAMAYNLCLASFGPHRGEHKAPAGAEVSSDPESGVPQRKGGGGPRAYSNRGHRVHSQFQPIRNGRGRMSLQFTIPQR